MSGRPHMTPEETKRLKDAFCELLTKSPLIESVCQKLGVSRSMFYRWKKEDPFFSAKVNEKIRLGRETVNDLAESKLIQLIEQNNVRCLFFWLNNNSPHYAKRKSEKPPLPTTQLPPRITRNIIYRKPSENEENPKN